MNLLKTFTFAAGRPDTFLVYWTNSVIQPKGILRYESNHRIRNAVGSDQAPCQTIEDDAEMAELITLLNKYNELMTQHEQPLVSTAANDDEIQGDVYDE